MSFCLEMAESFLDCESLDQWTQGVFDALITATRAVAKLPRDQDYGYYSSFVPFKKEMSREGDRLLGLTQRLLQMAEPRHAPKLIDPNHQQGNNVEDVAYRFDTTAVDVLDTLLEAVDNYADEATGDRQNPRVLISTGTVSGGKASWILLTKSPTLTTPL